MGVHRISLAWSRDGGPFERAGYKRDHAVRFDGGQVVNTSAAATYGGNAAYADPEQLFLAALSSCHMLTFLAVAANRGYVIDSYDDSAECELGKNAEGQTFVANAVLRPRIRFSGDHVPNDEDLGRLHERAHRACFISNSSRTAVRIEPQAA
jgi:organic hydroperoxide reductase OsmC/OhrA